MKKKIMRFLLMLCLLACAAPLAAQAQAPADVLVVPKEGMVIVSGTYYGISKVWFQKNNPDKGTVSVSVTIPSDVTTIANDGLRDSYSSDKKRYGAVTYNDNLGRYNLAAVDFSQAVNLKTINNQAAMSCTALTGVLDLSRTKIETLGKSAFRGCTGIEGVILPETLKSIGSKDAGSVFHSCSGLKFVRTAGGDPQATFELPKQLEVIGRQSFYNCTGLPAGTAVTIPASVTYVGSEAFHHTDPITTITVETDDASAYDGGAFKGNNYGLGKRLVVFRNAAAKNTFQASGLSSYKNAITYEFLLHYGNDPGARTEPKLYGQAVNVCKTDGRWSVEENYTLPKAEITDVPTGYTGGWAYNDALLTPNTVLKPAGDEFFLEVRKVLMNPTVEFIVDGETRASESSTLKLSLTNDREHTIGVRVSHPIETAPDADVKVKFEYQWTDVWKGGSQGPRMKEEGFGRYNLWDKPEVTNTISIDGPEDERTWQQKYSREDYGDGYYLVEIYGYSKPKSGGQWKLFYKSASTAIASDPQRTVNTAYVFDVITSGPPLLTLRNVSVSNVTESTAEITAETAAGAKVYYLSGAAAPDAAAIKAGGAFVTADAAGQVRIPLTGLTPETDYTWYLVAELSGHTDSRVAQTSFKTSEPAPKHTVLDAEGGTVGQYATFAEAFDAAQSGYTVVMGKDDALALAIPGGVTLRVPQAGYTLTVEDAGHLDGGTLEIEAGGTFRLDGATLVGGAADTAASLQLASGTAALSGGTMTLRPGAAAQVPEGGTFELGSGPARNAVIEAGATLTVADGGRLEAGGSLSVRGTLALRRLAAFSGGADVSGQVYAFETGDANPAAEAAFTLEPAGAVYAQSTDITLRGTVITPAQMETGAYPYGGTEFAKRWVYSEPEYTITFDANGGELSEASSARTVGGRLASLPVPVRGGHTFAGWRTEGGAEVTTDTVFTADATVYARWLSADAGVRAVAVDGTTGAILGTEITVVLPEGTPLPTDPRKVSVTPAAGAVAGEPVSTDGGATWTFTVTAEDGVTTERYVIHVSVAEPAMCTITFEPNGGSGTMSPVVIPAGTYPLPPCLFTAQRGYRFKGWRLNEVEYGPGGTFSLTGDVTLTALWEKIPGEAPVFIFPDGPQEVVVVPGEHGVMIVEAEGAVTYQWFVNRHDGQGYRRIPGATDPIYTTRAVKLEHDGFTYRCVATNAHGTAHSPVFTLRVREADLPPRTGDESRTGLWLALMLASLAALAALGWRWRRDGGNR